MPGGSCFNTVCEIAVTWAFAISITDGLPAGAAACRTGQGAPCTYQDDDGEMVTCVTPTGFTVAADKNLATENAGCTP